jgi:hypothetical protein
LQQVAKVSEAAVRVVALVVFALLVVIPAVIILTAAVFKKDAQDYANVFPGHVVDIFRTITPVHQMSDEAQPPTPGGTTTA